MTPSITNLIWIDLASNSGFFDEGMESDRGVLSLEMIAMEMTLVRGVKMCNKSNASFPGRVRILKLSCKYQTVTFGSVNLSIKPETEE